MNHRDNSFDLLRHFAALLVLYVHHFALFGLPSPSFPSWDTWGFVAVAIFFTISGFFMPTSFSNSANFMEFMEKRFRRIFPALIVCSFFMVYIIGSAYGAADPLHYIFSKDALKNWVMFSAFRGQNIPGVFTDFKFKYVMNGSIWTLPVEFAWYLIIGTALSVTKNYKIIIPLFFLSCIVTFMIFPQQSTMFYNVPFMYLGIFGIAFTTGAFLSKTMDAWLPYRLHLVSIAVLFLTICRGTPEMSIMGTLSLAILTVAVGVSFKDRIIAGKFDISYGIYIYAFPIQQIVINNITDKFWLSLAISTFFTIVAASLSYKFVEKPFLYKRNNKKEILINSKEA